MPALETEVAVVGAGITGAVTAYELTRSGRDVVVLEQFVPGHTRGSSHGASRVFRLSYPDIDWVRRAQDALAGWRMLEADLGELLLETTGSVDVGAYARANEAALQACGVPTSRVDPDDAWARWGLRLAHGEHAILQADAGVIAAARTQAALLDAARGRGAQVLAGTPVVRIDAEADRVRLTTPAGEIRAAVAVVAAGAWSARLLAPLGIELPVTPLRVHVAYLTCDRAANLPVLILEQADGVILYALADGPSTLKVGLHHGEETDPDEPGEPDPSIADTALDRTATRLPEARVALDRVETCLYTNTADESFVLRRHGRIVVASACSGHAFKFAPTTGRTVAALATEALQPFAETT